jgi:hypothetical protein
MSVKPVPVVQVVESLEPSYLMEQPLVPDWN